MENTILQVDYDYLNQLSNDLELDNENLKSAYCEVPFDTKSTISANHQYQEACNMTNDIRNKIVSQLEVVVVDIKNYGITFEEIEREL